MGLMLTPALWYLLRHSVCYFTFLSSASIMSSNMITMR